MLIVLTVFNGNAVFSNSGDKEMPLFTISGNAVNAKLKLIVHLPIL